MSQQKFEKKFVIPLVIHEGYPPERIKQLMEDLQNASTVAYQSFADAMSKNEAFDRRTSLFYLLTSLQVSISFLAEALEESGSVGAIATIFESLATQVTQATREQALLNHMMNHTPDQVH